MCLAVPARIVKIVNNLATIDIDGVRKEVGLQLLDDARVGDWVIVHAGFAIHNIDESEAVESLRLLREAVSLSADHPKKRIDSI